MSQAALKRWTVEEFFAWQEGQPDRYELVAGVPVRMMAGTSNQHDDTVVNLVRELSTQLRGGRCRPFTGDGAVETSFGQIRRPDAGVDCGRRDPSAFQAAEPRMVAEVFSPSTREFDAAVKVPEYKAVSTIDYILLLEPNAPEVILWSRSEDRAWTSSRVDSLDGHVDLPSISVRLSLSDLYDGVAFPDRPPGIDL